MADTKPVAGYFRVSQARDDMHAPDIYREQIQSYCSYRQLQLGEIFSDIDYSGYRGSEKRPALNELVRRRREFSAVVIPKLSRFGRSLKHLTHLFDSFDRDGISLVFLDLGMDTSTSQGRLLRNIMAAFAEYESDVRSDYSRAAIEHRARRGLPSGGWIAYGYRRDGDSYRIFEPQARVVREIFSLYDRGETMMGIARALNERALASPRRKAWNKPTVRKMLENHHYAALLRNSDGLSPGAWAPIISRSQWERVQQRLAAITNRGVCATGGLYLLSGLIHCEVCGSTLYHRTKQDRSPGQYICRGTQAAGYCRGGAIAEHRAEEMVASAYLERYGTAWVHDVELTGSPVPLTTVWQTADLETRRHMLRGAIDRLTLIARPQHNRRGTGLPRGRQLRIDWSVGSGDDRVAALLLRSGPRSEAARICAGCGRRKHISNFRLEDNGQDQRTDCCGRCRQAAGLRRRLSDPFAAVVAPKTSDRPHHMERAQEYEGITAERDTPDPKGKTWAQWQRECRQG